MAGVGRVPSRYPTRRYSKSVPGRRSFAPTIRRIAALVALLPLVAAITSCGDDPETATPVVGTSLPEPGPEPPTTPTTEPFPSREVLNYLEDMQGIAVRVGELVVDMRAANNDWDNRSETGASYRDTETRLEDIERRALALRDDIGLIEPPPDRGLPVEHQTASLALGQMADAAVDALAGHRSPDTVHRRRPALTEFLAAYERFGGAFDRIVQIIGVGAGVSLPTTGTTVAQPTTTTEAETTTTTESETTTTTERETTDTTEGETTTTTERETTDTTEREMTTTTEIGQNTVPPTPDVGY